MLSIYLSVCQFVCLFVCLLVCLCVNICGCVSNVTTGRRFVERVRYGRSVGRSVANRLCEPAGTAFRRKKRENLRRSGSVSWTSDLEPRDACHARLRSSHRRHLTFSFFFFFQTWTHFIRWTAVVLRLLHLFTNRIQRSTPECVQS